VEFTQVIGTPHPRAKLDIGKALTISSPTTDTDIYFNLGNLKTQYSAESSILIPSLTHSSLSLSQKPPSPLSSPLSSGQDVATPRPHCGPLCCNTNKKTPKGVSFNHLVGFESRWANVFVLFVSFCSSLL
jgi:hypothetical protein